RDKVEQLYIQTFSNNASNGES
ncbi:MAG TPA: transporter, partial [Alteromonas macleodii]|nr:transporter [Alteromonas macleodii]